MEHNNCNTTNDVAIDSDSNLDSGTEVVPGGSNLNSNLDSDSDSCTSQQTQLSDVTVSFTEALNDQDTEFVPGASSHNINLNDTQKVMSNTESDTAETE